MKRRELLILGSTLSLVACSLTLSMFYPAISAALGKPLKKPIPNHGSMKAAWLGVYWDQACANSVSSIDWGILEPGSEVNKTVYIRNQGNAAVTMAMTTSNWNPTNSSGYIGLVWDYTGQTIGVGETVQVKLTLSVSENAQGIIDFSFDSVIEPV